MHAGVMDPNVSATDEAHYNDLPQIVPDADMRCLDSMLTDEQRLLIIRSQEHLMLTDDKDHDDDTLDEHIRSLVSILADSSPTPQDPADRGKDFDRCF
ncbi:hypothetical protein RHGRI_038840 [Rhododendron griersonianum]|uniref:Uncharacterized protein n=1 Tax=Rhododendron griersonianum TaxID=479676 RepID=A0AAV6HLQ2_9ERIC|nr:hypothetical protein RHGRI_038840 [Rhododendron griersonianum]